MNKELSLEEKISLSESKIEKILLKWFTEDAVMLNTWCLINRKPDHNQTSMGLNVTGRNPIITYNPNFVCDLPVEYLEMVMADCGMKLLLRHCTTRLQEPRQITALASTVTVDELMMDNNKTVLQNDPSLVDFIPTAQKYGLPPKDCLEEYFRQLFDRQQQINEMIKQTWNSMTKEEKEQLLNNFSKPDNSNETKEDNKDDNGFKEFDNEKNALKDYYDPNGTANDGWGTNDMLDADIKNFVDNYKDKSRAWGKFTGNAYADIIAAQSSSFSFKEVIGRFKKSVTSYKVESSRMKVNRRFDLALPGYRRIYTTRIMFAIDISGSMSNNDLSYGFATVNNICRHIEMDYMQFDTEVKCVEKEFKKAKSTFKCFGRGGTDPTCVFEYMKTSKKKYDGCIIFTDGEFYSKISEPKFRVLWLLHSKNMKVPVNFGMIATLDRFENNHIY